MSSYLKPKIDSDRTAQLQDMALWSAALEGNIPLLTSLIVAKANVNMQNTQQDKESPLHAGVRTDTNRVEVIQQLLKARANVDAQDFKGETPLHKLLDYVFHPKNNPTDEAVFSLLVGAEPTPNVNLKNRVGKTALDFAARRRNPKICSEPVRRGATLDIGKFFFLKEEEIKERKKEIWELGGRMRGETVEAVGKFHYNKIEATAPFYKTGYLLLFANLIEQEHLQQHPEDHLLVLLNKDKKLLDETINKILNKASEDFFKACQSDLKIALEKMDKFEKQWKHLPFIPKVSEKYLKEIIIEMLSDFLKHFFLGERIEALFWQPYHKMILSNELDISVLQDQIVKYLHNP